MTTSRRVAEVASGTGFRAEMVEKVLRLTSLLRRLDEHPGTKGAWLLKGGTALNLLHLDVPRLSVDIDLNWVGDAEVDAMKQARPGFERALVACCEREGLAVRREPGAHAGGKWRLRYASVLGGTQNLEVDVSYVSRVPLWGATRLPSRFPPDAEQTVQSLRLEELAAGKFTALVQRSAARDAFDAARLLHLAPDLVERREFRIAFVCFAAGGRADVRSVERPSSLLAPRTLERDLVPLLRPTGYGAVPAGEGIGEWIDGTVLPAMDRLLTWSAGERRFIDRLLDEGEIEAEALDADIAVQGRIRQQSMLEWKARHVREHRRGN